MAHLGKLLIRTQARHVPLLSKSSLEKKTYVKMAISLSSLQSESIKKLDSFIQKFEKSPCKHSFAVNA